MKTDIPMVESLDITPTPRILRTLGDIPFAAWQCLAELMDNSLDAFADAENKGKLIQSPRIDIYWSTDSVPLKDREITIEDNGLGMRLDLLQKAAKAGYTNNGPIHNLGLFGMGFNIATARLGDETIFLSATPDDTEWSGIQISYEQLIKDQKFLAPVIRRPKKNSRESGTRIIIRKLNEGMFAKIRKKESVIKHQLEKIYTSILNRQKVFIYVQGKQLSARPHCVWGESRFVMRKGSKVEAVQHIDRDLGETYFDTLRNRYLTEDESIEIDVVLSKGGLLAENIVRRSRRLKGWIGIQRYSDVTDFGVDFIRNGRKILIADKTLFSYEHPDTGAPIQEYPVELGSTVGGRIVGELHVDYLIPTYQKNGFDSSGSALRLTVEAVRGAGPILPKKRAELGYDGDNESPMGKLINAYRRTDSGTKHLAIQNALAKDFAKHFQLGEREFDTDEKWFKAAQEADRAQGDGGKESTPVNTGDKPSDNIKLYLSGDKSISNNTSNIYLNSDSSVENSSFVTKDPINTSRDQLIQVSDKMQSLSGTYSYLATPGMEITAWCVRDGQIKNNGKRLPSHLFIDGIEVEYFYDPTHPILADYPISPKQLLLYGLAEKFSLRHRDIPMQVIFYGLIDNHFTEERINVQALKERALILVSTIREKLPSLLKCHFSKVKKAIHSVEAEEEELAKKLLEYPELLDAYQDSTKEASKSLMFIGNSTLKRIIAEFPAELMDGKLFNQPYLKLTIGNELMRERLRKNSLEKLLSYISDIILLLQGEKTLKNELLRYSNTLILLEGLID